MGDFNIDISTSCYYRKINTVAKHSNLNQLIKDYTRVTDKTKTIIDLAFISNPDRVSSSGVHSIGLSDHSLIYLIRKNKKVKVPPKIIKFCSMKNFDQASFINSLKKTNWNHVCNCYDVNKALDVWQSLFNKVCDEHAPIKGCGMGPWLVLVSPYFRENVVATCKIGSFLCSLDNLLQKKT